VSSFRFPTLLLGNVPPIASTIAASLTPFLVVEEIVYQLCCILLSEGVEIQHLSICQVNCLETVLSWLSLRLSLLLILELNPIMSERSCASMSSVS